MRALVVLAILACSGVADAQARVPVVLHVAQERGAPVASEEFIQRELDAANRIYMPLGIELVIAERRTFGDRPRLVSRADRDALGAHLVPKAVNWFVVAQLMDVDEPGRERRGVHWRVRRAPARRFVVTSVISGPYVLAHELGHFFGNPQHSDVVGNLMCYQHTDEVPRLDDAQVENVRRTLARMTERGELPRLRGATRPLP